MREERTVIVGAGVIGLTLGYELCRRGERPLLLDREGPGSGATRVAAGMLAPISEAEIEEKELIRFGLESLERYPPLVRELEEGTGIRCHLRPRGILWAALNRDEDRELEHLQAFQAMKGVSAVRLTARELLQREPRLNPRVVGGLLVETDRSLDPYALSRALAAAITAQGGEIRTGAAVGAVTARGGGWVVAGRHTRDGPFQIEAPRVVLCAGAWSTARIRSPAAHLEVRPVRGQAVILRGPPLLQHPIRNPRVYLVPRGRGEIMLGSTMEEMGFDAVPTGGGVMDLLRHAWLLLPGLYDLTFLEATAGLRPAVQDHLPVIGEMAPGFYVACGHFRGGILLAPATAHHLAAWITTGEAPAALAPFRPERMGRG